MARRFQLSATQYAGLALLGSFLIASVFVIDLPLDRWFGLSSWPSRLLVMLPFFGVGIALMLVAESRFRDGIQNGIWRDEETSRMRAVFTSPWWAAFVIAMLITSAVLMLGFSHHYRGIAWALLGVGQSLSRLGLAFRQTTPKNPSSFPSWSALSPIQSDHWGER